MAWHDTDSWLTAAFAPHPLTIALALLIVITLPILVHAYVFRRRKEQSLPTFLLVGPSGAGKTSLLTLLSHGTPSATHTSSTPTSTPLTLPLTATPASSRYRSTADPSTDRARLLRLLDTPGHAKLRHHAFALLSPSTTKPAATPTSTPSLAANANIRGIIFVVDAAALGTDAGAAEAGGYLHDILLALQTRHTRARSSKSAPGIPVLIAANKMDLFTALPAALVRVRLERAVEGVRRARSRGVREAGGVLDAGMEGEEGEREVLGGEGEEGFGFGLMEEYGVEVGVVGGCVRGDEGESEGGGDVEGWWEWVAEQL